MKSSTLRMPLRRSLREVSARKGSWARPSRGRTASSHQHQDGPLGLACKETNGVTVSTTALGLCVCAGVCPPQRFESRVLFVPYLRLGVFLWHGSEVAHDALLLLRLQGVDPDQGLVVHCIMKTLQLLLRQPLHLTQPDIMAYILEYSLIMN